MSQTSASTFVFPRHMLFSRSKSCLSLFATLVCLPALAIEQAEIEKALEGLPAEVRGHLQLAPPTSPAPSLDAKDPLKAAIAAALRIQGDDELRHRCLYQAARQALKQGRPALAQEISDNLQDYRAVLILAELAETLSLHDRARAEFTWDQAAQRVSRLKPWQAELVANKLVTSGHAMDLTTPKVAIWFQSIKDPLNRFVTGAEIKAIEAQQSGSFEMGIYRAERRSIEVQVPLPGLLEVASRLFEAGLKRGKDTSPAEQKRGQELIESGLEILAGSNVVHAEQVLTLAKKLYLQGKTELSRNAFEKVEKILGGPPEEVARLRYLMADLWQTRNKTETILPLLEKSEVEARQLESMYQPFAMAWLAAAWDKVGQPERALNLEIEGCRAALANVNPRIGWMGLFEVMLCHAVTARPLPDPLISLLKEKFSH